MTPHRLGCLAAEGTPTDPRRWEVMPNGSVSWLVDHRIPAAFPRLSPQWPLAGHSPLTVARQRRIHTGFPSSVSYSVVRPIMRGRLLPIRYAGLVERGHVVEDPDRGIQQRERQHGTGSLTQSQVEVKEGLETELVQRGCVP
jgi:hypothetical protein